MSNQQGTKIFFPNLDGLRFIAFFFVFSEHVIWACVKKLEITSPFGKHIAYTLFANGALGVSVFFVLSGFLITYLILKEIEVRHKLNVKAFYIRRFLRIWPLYYAVLLFAFYIYPFFISFLHVQQDVFAGRQIYYFTFLSNFDLITIAQHKATGSFLTGVTWSVAVEEQFYLIWPLLFFFVPKRGYVFIFLTVIAISFGFRCLHSDEPFVLYFHSLSVCTDLAIGGLSAFLALSSRRFISVFEELSDKWRGVIYIAGILYVVAGGYFLNHQLAVLFGRFLQCIFFAWVILDQNYSRSEFLKISKLKWMSKWGVYTYGMYLLHQISLLIVLNIYQFMNILAESFWQSLLKATIVFILTIILSYFSYHWFEKFFLKLKNRFSYFTKS
jgi:peptidoglycan/LPS O-acetylase OafA/YrhL